MIETIEYQDIHENRKYKDSLFRMVFKEKEHLLELYNAVNNSNYKKPEDLEITTLENVIYISMKNDTSFMVDGHMNLYEHQSTKNENMPLRGFLYFARLYEHYIVENALDLFSSNTKKLPTPKYVVFYNGETSEPDERILRLSDAFMKEGGCLECEAKLLNINSGHNHKLMEKCRRLEEYTIFVDTVRRYQKQNNNPKNAITLAMDECIKKGILLDILTKQRNEVLKVVLETFNKELYEKNLKEDAYSKGEKAGYVQGKKAGFDLGKQKGETNARLTVIKAKLAKGKTVEEIAEALELSVEKIEQLIAEL